MNLCMNPELACEVTLQPLERFRARRRHPVLRHPHRCPMPWASGSSSRRARARVSRARCAARPTSTRLPVPDPEVELRYVMDAVRLIRRELAGRVPLIGFAGSPWTLATYMVEGGGSARTSSSIKGMMYDQPALLHRLLAVVARAVTRVSQRPDRRGAQAVMVFDTWGGALTPRRLPRVLARATWRRSCRASRARREGRRVPVILFTKGGGQWLEAMAETGCDALGRRLDHRPGRCPRARRPTGGAAGQHGSGRALCLARASARRSRACSPATASGSGQVFNLGHGIHPDVKPEHAVAMVDAVHELSPVRDTT